MKCIFHKWNGCKCLRCGKVRDNLFWGDHDWNGCKCTICGKTRDTGHDYKKATECKAVCKICGTITPSVYHNWDGLICIDCGKTRDVQYSVPEKTTPSAKVWMSTTGHTGSSRTKGEDTHEAGNETLAPCGATKDARHRIENGKCSQCEKAIETIIRDNLKVSQWTVSGNSQSKYYSQTADNLVNACEILKQLPSIPPMTYYLVDTPDGTLGRDAVGFFTESPLKTKGLHTSYRCYSKSNVSVESQSLMNFSDIMKTQSAVAAIKASGQYASLILMMKCGQCGYESPVETHEGDMERECYFCGTNNKSHRGEVNVYTAQGMVKL